MNGFKKVLNVFGIILGVIFSFALIASLVVAPTLSGATNFFKTENLKKIVAEIDFEALMQDSLGGEDAEVMSLMFEEGIMDELLSLYVEDLFAQLDGTQAAPKLTEDAVHALCLEHIDVFVTMVKAQLDEETLQFITDGQIEEIVKTDFLPQFAGEVVIGMPTINDLGLDDETLNVMAMFRDGLIGIVGIVLVAVFAVIVFICQFPRFKSFMWLGVDFIIGGGLTFFAATGFEFLIKLVATDIPFGNMIMNPIVETFASAMRKGALVELGLAVLFIVIFIVGRVLLKKKAAPQAV